MHYRKIQIKPPNYSKIEIYENLHEVKNVLTLQKFQDKRSVLLDFFDTHVWLLCWRKRLIVIISSRAVRQF
jgi:hypothetical protein